MNNLSIGSIISNGISLGLKNLGALVVNIVLWIITIWIPYLNVGTTIGIVGLVPKMSKGDVISPTEVFNPVYRKRMGEFFLGAGFIQMGTIMGMVLLIIPGYVIAIAWSLTLFLIIDKEMNPIQAINESNSLTYGKKWIIFLGLFLLELILFVGLIIIAFIFSKIAAILGILVYLAGIFTLTSIMMGAMAHIYGTLTK